MERSSQPENKVYSLHNWKEWKEAWDTNFSLEVRSSLLHCGFKMIAEEMSERLKFYLALAESSRADLAKTAEEERNQSELSKKAFEVLCQSFFKQQDYTYEHL